ncbi:Nn.00g089080.m01.CDS01 [Neocucurbitaria sp. VM-36]
MSAAHTCFRSALTQAFRPSNRGIAASCSVASFLVPALARPSKRPFSSRENGSKKRPRPSQVSIDLTRDVHTSKLPPKANHERIPARIRPPPPHTRGDIQQWLAAIDAFLPIHLQRDPSSKVDISSTVTAIDISRFLNNAQNASHDILSYLGLNEGRWQTAIWIVKKLVEDGRRSIEPPTQPDLFVNAVWPGTEQQSLKDLTQSPIRTERVRPPRKMELSLNHLTSEPESIVLRHVLVKRALGQLWRSLGNMILVATERSSTDEDTIMPHVLEIIAHLHHIGFMPDSVYTYRPHENKYALQQPPTLHMLSSKILTALSDATWKAHEASVVTAKQRANASYFLGHEIPGSRYKVQVTEVAPELWLELVLWSCLHGGWIVDGIAILEQLASRRGEDSWALISWREIMQAQQEKTPAQPPKPSRAWRLFHVVEDASASPEDRARTRRTISGEIVTCFIDGLLNEMRLGIGQRGVDPESLVNSILVLKKFLEGNNLSLGSTSWDSIIVRLLESGGFMPEKRPELLLRVFDLASGFGTEVSAANASTTVDTEVPYFFEPTTIPLSLLHRAMREFIGVGDIKGAMSTLMLLQQHTDDNKQKSVQQFFELLRSVPPSRMNEPFTSRLPPVDFPVFDAKLPVSLLARLLDLATQSKLYDLGRWLLFSDDLDGPLIGPELYSHRNIAASIVRFGTLAGENDLVVNIVKKVGTWNAKYQQQRMPAEILTALLCCQFKLRRWESVRGMQKYVKEIMTFRPRPVILSTFAAELLRTSAGSEDAKGQAQEAFSGLLFDWENLILSSMRNELYCILSIMSTVHSEWKEYCSRFLAFSSRQSIKLSTNDFNQVLSGVLDGYGSTKGKDIVETWCYQLPTTFEPYRAPGGLPTMPQFRVGKGKEYEDRPEDIELVQDSGATLILHGRVSPNRQTIWAILRKAQEEVDSWRQLGEQVPAAAQSEIRDTLKWASRILYYLGFDYEDIIRDLGSSLAEFAELEAPMAPSSFGPDIGGIE